MALVGVGTAGQAAFLSTAEHFHFGPILHAGKGLFFSFVFNYDLYFWPKLTRSIQEEHFALWLIQSDIHRIY